MNVLALMPAEQVSGPCRGLFQLIDHTQRVSTQSGGVSFIVGFFIGRSKQPNSAMDEAARRGYHVVTLRQTRRYDLGLIPQAWRIVRERKATILQSHGYKPATLGWLLKHLTGLPWVAFAHGYTSENRRMAVYNWLDRWLLKRADRVVAVSESTARLLEEAGVPEDRIRVIHNAIDYRDRARTPSGAEFRRLCKIAPDDLLVGVIGRLSPEKGQQVFLQAFRAVASAVPRARAVFVGEGQGKANLRSSARALGLAEAVTFAGFQPDMGGVYAALDLVVIPSLSEGLPNVLLEAMAHGKAVVSTNVGGIPEVMCNGLSQLLVSPDDASALAKCVIKVLKDPGLRSAQAEAGANRIRRMLSPDQRARKVTDVYQELIGEVIQ